MYQTGAPYGRPGTGQRWLALVFVAFGVFVLGVFVLDKLLAGAPSTRSAALSTVIAHLEKHDVRRVTVPARTILIELNDGSKMTVAVPSDRDLGPVVRRSGADLALASTGTTTTPLLAYVLQFVPFVIMAILLLFILRIARRQRR
jgi:ATP-dependent Zn protease